MGAIERIEDWFGGQYQDADFIRCPHNYPFDIIGPKPEGDRVVYCTKKSIAYRALQETESDLTAGLIARCGLPHREEATWLREFIGERKLIFVGDLDPVDIMVFAWLRQRLEPITTVHHGINDSFVAALDVVIPNTYRIQLKPTEAAAVAELGELIPDVRDVLGPECFRILNEGYKIELEAVVSALGSARPLLTTATDSGA